MSPTELQRLALKFDRLFERRPDPRTLRNPWVDRLWIAGAYARGDIRLRPVRIPLVFSQAADMTWSLAPKHGESLDHLLMKHAAWVWMAANGAEDARLEVHGVYGGRPDVYSKTAHWIVECGNTPIAKVRRAVRDRAPPRFTLIPHQDAASFSYANGTKTVGLLGVDISWTDDLRREVEDDETAEPVAVPVHEMRRRPSHFVLAATPEVRP